LRIAAQDLDGARLLNQAAEKLIRAVLTSEGPLKPALRAIEHLDAYATAFRYPSPRGRIKPAPSPRELDEDVATLTAVLGELVARFVVELGKPDQPAGKPDPIR
jgi:hypothetical protein